MRHASSSRHAALVGALAFGALTASARATAQEPPPPDTTAASPRKGEKRDRAREVAPLFATTAPLGLTLTFNVRRILGDRDTTQHEHPRRWAVVSYAGDSAGAPITIPAEVRVRGVWRLHHCQFPPLRLRIAKEAARGTVFEGERSPKLVTHCGDTDEFEQYVLHEYAIYRMQALVTPVALRARLARVTYVDSASRRPAATRAAILLEDEDNLAERLGGRVLQIKGVPQGQLEPYDTFVMGLFQFMIGNTDWSVPGLHNIEIIKSDSAEFPRHYALAYDWDFTGLVAAAYAAPDRRLRIRTVRNRLYRGVCPSQSDLPRAVALFNEKRAAILAVYSDVPGLKPTVARDGRAFLEEFFRIINDPRRLRRDVIGDCEQGG